MKQMKYCKHMLNAKFPHRILYTERRPKRLLVKVPVRWENLSPILKTGARQHAPRGLPNSAHPYIPFSISSQNAFDSVEDLTKKQVKKHPRKLPEMCLFKWSGNCMPCRKTVRPGANCPNFSGRTLLKAFLENSNTHFCQPAKENAPKPVRGSGKQWPYSCR